MASLVKHFRSGLVTFSFEPIRWSDVDVRCAIAGDLIAQVSTKKGIAVIARDISWLWRMAYNSAVKGCSTWDCPDDLVSDLFDISREVRANSPSPIQFDL